MFTIMFAVYNLFKLIVKLDYFYTVTIIYRPMHLFEIIEINYYYYITSSVFYYTNKLIKKINTYKFLILNYACILLVQLSQV